jgi:inner membrane protein
MTYQPPLPAANTNPPKQFSGSFMLKILTIGGLIALLLIPLLMVDSLVDERKAREREAKDGIAMGWAPRLQLGGPMLVIPYKGYIESEAYYGGVMRKVNREVTNYIYFFPNKLKVNADAKVSERRRGIFKANIFSSEMKVTGEFGRIDVRKYDIPNEHIDWNNAFILMTTPNGKSVSGEPIFKMNDLEMRFQPRWQEKYISSYHLRADVGDARKLLIGESHPFSFDLSVRGTEELNFLPSANDFSVNVTSDWSTPSFQGVSLPFEHKLSKKGFSASWSDSLQDHNASLTGTTFENISMPNLAGTAFGVTFFDSVDKYQQTERTIKYGMLFILLTFLSFFLFEIKAKLQLHPFQYLLIGSANCMFYLLLLSLSEHIEFGVSYLIASTSVVLLIAGYAKAILGQILRSGVLSGVLAVFYGTMFFILIEQEYALLFGSFALYFCLVTVMYLTRHINWYKLRDTSEVLPQT